MNDIYSHELFDQEDIEQNRLMAGLGYLVFFLPMIFCKRSKLGRYCANQGLLLMIVSLLLSGLLGVFTGIPLLGWLFELAGRLVRFVLVVIGVLCFIQLQTSRRVIELPIIGRLRILN